MNYIRVIEEIFQQYHGPKFSLKLWDDKERYFGTGNKIDFTLSIRDALTVQRLLSQGSLGFGESYMEGSLQVDGDIESYLRMRHHFKRVLPSPRLVLAKFLSNRQVPKDRKSQITSHYDLGNDFFKLILDSQTMSYSAGRYEDGTETLAKAQQKKLELISKWLGLSRGSSVLDLGFGWGGFALLAAKKYEWKVTGYTLSNAQLSYSQKLIKRNKLDSKVTFKDADMLTSLPTKQFDGIVMIESIEHVGQKLLTPFLQNIRLLLKPGASFIIQTTGRYKPKPVDKWTLKYVFPGGYLPAKSELLAAAESAGLIVEEFRDDTTDYIKTMSEWIQNLEDHRSEIESMFDQSFFRLWQLWMHGAKVNFEIGAMSLFRIHLRNPK